MTTAIKTILKLTPTIAVVKISGIGNNTISLSSDLVYSNTTTGQVDVPGNGANAPVVNIRSLVWSIPGTTAATVVRNSVNIWDLLGTFQLEFNGYADTQQNTSDIVVTLAGAGEVILELLKVSGYGQTQTLNSKL